MYTDCMCFVSQCLAFQHINNTVYFRYQEEARLKFFMSIMDEVDPKQTEFDHSNFVTTNGLGPIVSDTYCKVLLSHLYSSKTHNNLPLHILIVLITFFIVSLNFP